MTGHQFYVRQAFEKIGEVAERATPDEVSVKPFGAGTTSIAALVVHCCGMTEFWLGHVALGRPSARERDAEFEAEATHEELRAMLATTIEQADADLARIEAGDGQPSELRELLDGGPSDESLVLHVIEELYQHLGHMEITADVLEHRR